MTKDGEKAAFRMSRNGLEPAEEGKAKGSGFEDKKKMVLLGLLLAVGVGIVAHRFLKADGPQAASAGMVVAGGESGPLPDMSALAGRLDAAEGEDMAVAAVEQLIQEFDSHVQRRQVPGSDLHANPFAVRLSDNRQREEAERNQAAEAAAEARRRDALAAAGQLTLGTIMVAGPKRWATINGKVYGVGDRVEGFHVVEIDPHRVVLERDGVTAELMLRGGVRVLKGN